MLYCPPCSHTPPYYAAAHRDEFSQDTDNGSDSGETSRNDRLTYSAGNGVSYTHSFDVATLLTA